MSTKYSVIINDEKLPLGFRSNGWAFRLYIYPDRGLTNDNTWLQFIRKNKYTIINEYEEIVPKKLLEQIMYTPNTSKKSKQPFLEYLQKNHALWDDKNKILRCKLEEINNCVGRSYEKPIDYISFIN